MPARMPRLGMPAGADWLAFLRHGCSPRLSSAFTFRRNLCQKARFPSGLACLHHSTLMAGAFEGLTPLLYTPMDPSPIVSSDALQPWEEQYARWLALQTTRVDFAQEQAAVRILVGHDLSQTALNTTKRKLAWRRAYQIARAELGELHLARARDKAISTAPKAMRVYGKAVGVLESEIDRVATNQAMGAKHPDFDKDLDAMKPLRVAPHLLNPFLDRVIPKKVEKSVALQSITINLSPEQMTGMDAPVMVVEASEVPKLPSTTSGV